MDSSFRFAPVSGEKEGEIQSVSYDAAAPELIRVSWRPVRPIPRTDGAFETVWEGFRRNRNL